MTQEIMALCRSLGAGEDQEERLLPLVEKHEMVYHWIKGHAETEENNRCDQLAVAESRKF